MNRSMIFAAVLVAVVGGGAAWWFSQGTEAPSTDVTAPPVETTTTIDASGSTSATTAPENAVDGADTYVLTDASTASFTLTEELRGTPTTVVGTSTIVLGEIRFDPADPSSIQIGTILVNARDFSTDSSNRNRAIRGPILDADTFEFIEFMPTSIEGFDGSGAAFSVSGDLRIRDVTHPVTFDVTASADGESVTGTAIATIDRTMWNLSIPSAPGIANVSESVTLTLDFVAAPAS